MSKQPAEKHTLPKGKPEGGYTHRCAPTRWAGCTGRGWWPDIHVLWSSATSMRWIPPRAIDLCPRAPYFPVQACLKAVVAPRVRLPRPHSPALCDVSTKRCQHGCHSAIRFSRLGPHLREPSSRVLRREPRRRELVSREKQRNISHAVEVFGNS